MNGYTAHRASHGSQLSSHGLHFCLQVLQKIRVLLDLLLERRSNLGCLLHVLLSFVGCLTLECVAVLVCGRQSILTKLGVLVSKGFRDGWEVCQALELLEVLGL